MALRRDDSCCVCACALSAGTRAQWDPSAKVVTCLSCVGARREPTPTAEEAPTATVCEDGSDSAANAETPVIDAGTPGASAQKEHDRRRAKREREIEEKWGSGRIGRFAKFLADDPQSTRAWKQGAEGERRVAKALHEGLGETAVILHDRRAPGTRGNIDHLVVAPSGLWVIDAKKYSGKVERRDVGGWFRTDLRLYVGGRDRTKLLDGLGWQTDAVHAALDPATAPIHPVLTFVAAEWSLFAKPLRLDDVWICWPKKLPALIRQADAVLTGAQVEEAAQRLSERLPAN